MNESKDLPRGLEGLRKLAGGTYCDLWGVLFEGNESDWNVTRYSKGSLRDTLSRLADEIEAERPVITDAERRALEMWPRFEDGEPVMPGDRVMLEDGAVEEVYQVYLGCDGFSLYTETHDDDYRHGERVKRATEVLDADDVPIEVGDTVYLLPGEWCDVFPCLHFYGGEELKVITLFPGHAKGGIRCQRNDGCGEGICFPLPSQVSHQLPDSWELLEKDAREFARDNQLPHDAEQMERDALYLIRRAKALAGVE